MLLEQCFSFYLLTLLFSAQLHSHTVPDGARRSLSFPDLYSHNRKLRGLVAPKGLGNYLIDSAWVITMVRQMILLSMTSLVFVLPSFVGEGYGKVTENTQRTSRSVERILQKNYKKGGGILGSQKLYLSETPTFICSNKYLLSSFPKKLLQQLKIIALKCLPHNLAYTKRAKKKKKSYQYH